MGQIESSIETHILLYVKQMANGDLLSSTGSSTQYSATTQTDEMEGGVGDTQEGADIHILMAIHVVVWQRPIQYCKAIILQLKIK